jgi:hypothetical protein
LRRSASVATVPAATSAAPPTIARRVVTASMDPRR